MNCMLSQSTFSWENLCACLSAVPRHRTGIIALQDDYELEENDADLMAQSTPYHWRMRAHALSHGAFHGLKVLTSQACYLMMPVTMQPNLLLTHQTESLILFSWVR